MKKYSLLLIFIGTLVMIVVMTKTGASLKTSTTPKGILDLEFAYNTAKTTTVLNAWVPNNIINNINAAKNNTWLDFIFLFFYSLFLFYTCKKISRIITGGFGNTGILIAHGALWAGFLDIFENAGMLITLSGYSSTAVAFITTFCSVIKWGLVVVAVGYILSGLIKLIAAKKINLLFT